MLDVHLSCLALDLSANCSAVPHTGVVCLMGLDKQLDSRVFQLVALVGYALFQRYELGCIWLKWSLQPAEKIEQIRAESPDKEYETPSGYSVIEAS